MKTKFLLPVILVAIATIAAGWTVWHRGNAKAGVLAGRDDADSLQALIDMQSAQSERLDRIEAMLARNGQGGAASGSATTETTRSLPRQEIDPDREPEQQRQAARDRVRQQVDAKFAAETLSPAWSQRNEKLIDTAFSAESLAALGAPKPSVHDASCRSRTCRISMVYANDQDADAGQLFLLSSIGGQFNASQPFQRTLPDGRVEITMYSTSEPKPRMGLPGQ